MKDNYIKKLLEKRYCTINIGDRGISRFNYGRCGIGRENVLMREGRQFNSILGERVAKKFYYGGAV